MAAGSYVLTAEATDNLGVTVTSSPITVKISKALEAIRRGKNQTTTTMVSGSSSLNLTSDATQTSAQLDSLVSEIAEAYNDFTDERSMFDNADKIDNYLFAAWFLARSSAALSQQPTPSSGVEDRLKKIDSYLSFCEDLMVDGAISKQTLIDASRVNAWSDLKITEPETRPAETSSVMLSSNGTARISSTSPSTPLTTQTASGGASYEMAGVSVTVNGWAASLLSVSPTEIVFNVPSNLAGGLADILVTSQDGYISHSTAIGSGLNPTIFTIAGDPTGEGAILEAVSFRSGPFAATTEFVGLDNRTRLAILATGISSGVTNTDFTNDIRLNDGSVIENLAESVRAEARTDDGRLISLPVEFAGSQGSLRGLDQVNVVLVPELQGAGAVQLTLVVNGQRSNMVTVVVR